MMKTKLYSITFTLLSITLSTPAFSSSPFVKLVPEEMQMIDNNVPFRLSPQAILAFDKLLPEEVQRLKSAQTPDEKTELGRAFAFEKFGRDLLQDERDQIAVSLFEASRTPKALGKLGYLYKEDRAGLDLQEDQRYTRAKELLERDSSPWAFSIIGDMYYYGRFAHSGGKAYNIQHIPNYRLAAEYYRKSRTGYSWYKLGYLYNKTRSLFWAYHYRA